MARKLFCFGFGYTAGVLAQRLAHSDITVVGTRRQPHAGEAVALAVFDSAHSPGAEALLAGTTHVLISIPPDVDGDPVLRWHAEDLAKLTDLRWIGYLSTIGVYGDTAGAWVDETSPVRPGNERARRRAKAEGDWRAFGLSHGKRVEIFRLPGIYGPGRSQLDAVMAGTARRIVKPGQVFNRVHVADIAAALAQAVDFSADRRSPSFDVFNVVDNEPAPPQDVVAYAAGLLGLPPPPLVPFEAADLSPMGRSFYAENKRVRNDRLTSVFGFVCSYPTYREGLAAIAQPRQPISI